MTLLIAMKTKLLVLGFNLSELEKSDIGIRQQFNFMPDNSNCYDSNVFSVKNIEGAIKPDMRPRRLLLSIISRLF